MPKDRRRIAELERLLRAALRRIDQFETENKRLGAKNAHLRERLILSSDNSSKPPSSDPASAP